MRRVGKFTIPAQWVAEMRPEVTRVMGMCGVIRAEHFMHTNEVEYWAYCYRFREVSLGEVTPTYRWLFTAEGDVWCEECDRGHR